MHLHICMLNRISFCVSNKLQPSLSTSLFIQIEFVSSSKSQKIPFELSELKTKNLTLAGFSHGGAIFGKTKQIFYFQKFCQRAQLEFSDFVMKKQIQSGQIMKRLVVFAGCRKYMKLILMTSNFIS